ncbi:MAG: glycosyltransferase family 39 protein, partial [Hyphomonadaceae bacterium]|nr:glycosyltransferase family 39 protein [Hyphomonadaceae bacterium]
MRSPVSPALYDQFARGWRGYVLIALIALLSAQFGAGRVQAMDADEARFAQATRQMVETGDYVNIRIQETERNRKPVGVHWLQATAVHLLEPITERTNAIWAYRLPSTLGLMLAALATLWAGTTLLGQRPAFFGAALFASGMLAGFEGMTAKTDALLLGFTTLALAAIVRLRFADHGRPRSLSLLFWFAFACGVLIKGPVTPLVVGLTLAALALWEKRAAWMKALLWWPGPLLAAAMILPWSIAISAQTEGRFFFDMLFGDLAPKLVSGQEGHFALPGYHLFLLPLLIFPATYALPAAARLGWETIRAPRNDETHAPYRFLLAWVLPTFLFFELAPTKLAHYTLPTYPAIALLCGAGLAAMIGRPWRTTHPIGIALFAVFGAVIVAIMATAATFMFGDFSADLRRAISTALIGVLIVGAAVAGLIVLRRPAVRAAILVACALMLSFSLRERILPEARAINVSSETLAALTRARLTPRANRPLWVVGYTEPSLIF